MEHIDYIILFRWFIGLHLDEPRSAWIVSCPGWMSCFQ